MVRRPRKSPRRPQPGPSAAADRLDWRPGGRPNLSQSARRRRQRPAQEAPWLKARFGPAFKLITPGIRLPDDAKGDQTRVVTPVDAIKMGSDYLVIGRSITGAKDPIVALQNIAASLNG